MTARSTTRTAAQFPSSPPSPPVDEAPARTPAQQPAHVRLAGLDGVRGIAVLAVMAYHFALFAELPTSATWLDSTVATVTNTGWVGVDLFFVLSGFLITGILYDAAAAPTGYFRAFYARRALRILPVYFGFLAVLLWLLPAVHSMQSADFHELRRNQLWFWGFSANIWMAGRQWWQANLYGTGHLWSLAIEEQFYIVWPAVVLLSRRRGLMAIAAIAIVVPFVLRIALWQADAR
ncbi:MAG: acyltransferase, partial [Dehalococcoidia bacterium]